MTGIIKREKTKSLLQKNINHLNPARSKRVVFELNEEDLFVGSPYCYDLTQQQIETNRENKTEPLLALQKRFGI